MTNKTSRTSRTSRNTMTSSDLISATGHSRYGSYPIPTTCIGKGLPTTNDSDDLSSKNSKLYYDIVNGNSVSSDDMLYIVTNSDMLLSDDTTYPTKSGSRQTIGSAISSRMTTDSTFLHSYHSISDIITTIKLCNSATSVDHTICSKDIYYIGIAIKHIDICNMLSNITTTSAYAITTPTGSIMIPCSVISSDGTRHYYSALRAFSRCSSYNDIPTGSEVGKAYAMPTNLKGTTSRTVYSSEPTTICPTRPINNIKTGSSAIALYRDDRCKHLNRKTLKDILPVNSDITKSMSDSIDTIHAMRIDSGIAPSIVWTGNSRDYMIIGIYDYDTTNYYCLYSTDIYSDDDIYHSIYNTYNTTYDSYAKYAMDTTIHKYHKVFNDDKYVSYAFDLKKGIVGKAPILPKLSMVHKTYQYDDMYYMYKRHYDMFYDNMEIITLYSGSDSTNIPYVRYDDDNGSLVPTTIMYSDCTTTFNPTTYFSRIIDSINSYDDSDSRLSIAIQCKNYINSIISTIRTYGSSEDSIDMLLSGVDSVYYYATKDTTYIGDYSLYYDDLFEPTTIKLHKGYKGTDSTTYTKPTYVSGRLSRISGIMTTKPMYRYQVLSRYYSDLHLFTYLGKTIISGNDLCSDKGAIKWYYTTFNTFTTTTIKGNSGKTGSSDNVLYSSTFKKAQKDSYLLKLRYLIRILDKTYDNSTNKEFKEVNRELVKSLEDMVDKHLGLD